MLPIYVHNYVHNGKFGEYKFIIDTLSSICLTVMIDYAH